MIDRLVAPLLLLGCVVLGVMLIVDIKEPDRMAMPPHALDEQAAPLPPLRRLARVPVAPPIAAILARPLFSPSRRPPQSNSDNAADDAGLADSRLAGIIIESGRRFAIFAPQGAKPLMVTEGETLSGWRVDSISPQEVSLSGPDGTKTLQPKFDPNLAPPVEDQTPPAPVFGVPPNIRTAPGVVVPQPGAPVFIPGQARLRQLRRR
jgi:hypothetical protein